ncbi:MAG: tol-pal system protein YbgF [Alphaproteobacteria bacterium]|nr:tol-pal system protein YbgF [Alphaproteobacteria bacterium]
MKLSKISLSCILTAGILTAGILSPAVANAQSVPLYRHQKTPTSYQQQQQPLEQSSQNTPKVQGELKVTPTKHYPAGYAPQNSSQMAQRGQVYGSPHPTQAQYASQSRPQSQDVVAMHGIRISQLEEIIRRLTGQIEQLNHRIAEQSQQLAIMAKDVNYRFRNLEQSNVSGNQGTVAPQPMGRPIATNPAVIPNQPINSIPLQTASHDKPAAVPAAPSPWAQATVTDGATSPNAMARPPATEARPTDRTMYNEAYSLLRKGQYDGAEKQLKRLLKEFPNSNLAGNAQYWLGETYYARKNFEQAAIAFADGYKKYSTSTKGPDNLLKLGLSMKALGKKGDACVAFGAVVTTFPDAPNAIKQRAKNEAAAARCE